MPRPIAEIAQEIRKDWKNPYFGAVPYLDAMGKLNEVTDKYGWDDADSIIRYFLVNAHSWRGAVARRIKLELKELIK